MEILVYLKAFSSNSTNKKGRTSQYLPLMSPCGDPCTSPTRTSPHSGLPKRFYRPFVQFPNLCARYAFRHCHANDADCGWDLRWVSGDKRTQGFHNPHRSTLPSTPIFSTLSSPTPYHHYALQRQRCRCRCTRSCHVRLHGAVTSQPRSSRSKLTLFFAVIF